MTELDSFRQETRAWLEANCPPEMRKPVTSENDVCWGGRNFKFQSEAQKHVDGAHGRTGWTVPDLAARLRRRRAVPASRRKVLRQEMRAHRRRSPLDSFGIWMLGPALLQLRHRGAEAEHLPKIARGEIRWCQGYSEPGRRVRPGVAADARRGHRATTSSSTARRSGPPTPTRPTGSSAWCAPTPARRSTTASASCCSTWQSPGVTHPADPADLRQVAVLRDLLRQCEGAEKHNLVGDAEPRLGRSPSTC